MKWITYLFFSFVVFQGNAQDSIERVKIRKSSLEYYRCTTNKARDWILISDNSFEFYLINVQITDREIANWFKRFRDSQNIYKSGINEGAMQILHFRKDNEPQSQVDFYYTKNSDNQITLSTFIDGSVFIFQKVEQ